MIDYWVKIIDEISELGISEFLAQVQTRCMLGSCDLLIISQVQYKKGPNNCLRGDRSYSRFVHRSCVNRSECITCTVEYGVYTDPN